MSSIVQSSFRSTIFFFTLCLCLSVFIYHKPVKDKLACMSTHIHVYLEHSLSSLILLSASRQTVKLVPGVTRDVLARCLTGSSVFHYFKPRSQYFKLCTCPPSFLCVPCNPCITLLRHTDLCTSRRQHAPSYVWNTRQILYLTISFCTNSLHCVCEYICPMF